jgi:hypothetical protein
MAKQQRVRSSLTCWRITRPRTSLITRAKFGASGTSTARREASRRFFSLTTQRFPVGRSKGRQCLTPSRKRDSAVIRAEPGAMHRTGGARKLSVTCRSLRPAGRRALWGPLPSYYANQIPAATITAFGRDSPWRCPWRNNPRGASPGTLLGVATILPERSACRAGMPSRPRPVAARAHSATTLPTAARRQNRLRVSVMVLPLSTGARCPQFATCPRVRDDIPCPPRTQRGRAAAPMPLKRAGRRLWLSLDDDAHR